MSSITTSSSGAADKEGYCFTRPVCSRWIGYTRENLTHIHHPFLSNSHHDCCFCCVVRLLLPHSIHVLPILSLFSLYRYRHWRQVQTKKLAKFSRRPTPPGTVTRSDWAFPRTRETGPKTTWATGWPGPSENSPWPDPTLPISFSHFRYV